MKISRRFSIFLIANFAWSMIFSFGYNYPETVLTTVPFTSFSEANYQERSGTNVAPIDYNRQLNEESFLKTESYPNLVSTIACKNEPDGIIFSNDPDELTTILNQTHRLADDYIPDDIVVLNKGVYTVRVNIYLRREAANAVVALLAQLEREGINVRINSGWRTNANQVAAYNDWVRIVGSSSAKRYVALPGHSEHHLGTTIDIGTEDNGYAADESLKNTKLGIWMENNAHKYGLVMSYPEGKTSITGYNYEPWHYRYVGVDIATEIKARGITLTEFLYEFHNICS